MENRFQAASFTLRTTSPASSSATCRRQGLAFSVVPVVVLLGETLAAFLFALWAVNRADVTGCGGGVVISAATGSGYAWRRLEARRSPNISCTRLTGGHRQPKQAAIPGHPRESRRRSTSNHLESRETQFRSLRG